MRVTLVAYLQGVSTIKERLLRVWFFDGQNTRVITAEVMVRAFAHVSGI